MGKSHKSVSPENEESSTSLPFKSKLPRRSLGSSGELGGGSESKNLLSGQSTVFRDVWKLYTMHFCFVFISRMWDIGIVLLVAQLMSNSLTLVAAIGFASSFSIFAFMPMFGAWMDRTDRMRTVKLCVLVKFCAITAAYSLCAYLIFYQDSVLHGIPLVYALPVLHACAGMSFSIINQSVEKDWVVVLSGGDFEWLSNTNATMSQIDLFCNSMAPSITGVMFYMYSGAQVALTLMSLNALASISFFIFMQRLYFLWPPLQYKSDGSLRRSRANSTASQDSHLEVPLGQLELPMTYAEEEQSESSVGNAAKDTWWCRCSQVKRSYFNDFIFSGCASSMVAYAMLYCTVLSYGPLMLVYLTWAGVPEYWIGMSSGASSLFGFSGSLLFPLLSKKLGLFDLAFVAMIYDTVCVCVGAASFLYFDKKTSAIIVIIAVLLSRMGLWTFDLCVRQIAQETISELTRGKVNGIWRSMTSFFTMGSFLGAMVLPNPNDFWILTCISAGMVVSCLVLFWLANIRMFTCFGGTGDMIREGSTYSTLQKYEDDREKTAKLSQQQLYGGMSSRGGGDGAGTRGSRVSDQFQIEMQNTNTNAKQ